MIDLREHRSGFIICRGGFRGKQGSILVTKLKLKGVNTYFNGGGGKVVYWGGG